MQPLHEHLHHTTHSTGAAELLAGARTQHTPLYLCFITLLYLLVYTAFVTLITIAPVLQRTPVQHSTAWLQAMPAQAMPPRSPLGTQQQQPRPHIVLAALSGNPRPDGCICK